MICTHVFFAAAVVIAPVEGQRRANPHFVQAEAAYRAERWDDAAEGFAAAYADDPRPEYLYAQGQAERHAGRCDDAIETYERFIALDPPDEAVTDARANVEKCETVVAAAAPSPRRPEARPDPAPVERPPPVVDDEPPRPRWIADPWGGVLTWTGLAAAATGGFLVGDAHRRETRARRATDEQGYRDALQHAPAMSRAGIAVLSVGGALLVAGIVRYATLGAAQRRARRAQSGVAVVPGRRSSLGFVVRW